MADTMFHGDHDNAPLAKTLSFACVHFFVAFCVGYLLTGSLVVGSALALVEPLCNTVAFYFHERAWNRLSARRDAARTHDRFRGGGLMPTGA